MPSNPATAECRPVIALGGCHITGYPFAQKQSFLDVALASMAWQTPPLRCAPASFSAIDLWLAEHGARLTGARVVLQLGNYESIRGASLAQTNEQTPTPPASRSRFGNQIGKNHLKEAAKYGAVLGKWLTGRLPYDGADFSRRLAQTFATIRDLAPREVVVLASFCSFSPAVNLCRSRLNRDMARVTGDFDFLWLDSYAHLRAHRSKGESLFHDTIHLSEAGHALVGAQLAAHWRATSLDLPAETSLPIAC